MRSRGYTLIEIAGVMVVLGLLLGASLWPLDRQLREFEYRQERANMERLRDTVVGYALRHRTPGVEIIMVNDDGIPVQPGFYAPGRPYLPCSDIDNDGIENRLDLINPVVQTLSRSVSPYPRFDYHTPIIYSGACSTNKGQLPWRTLGSIPADYWSNRYTYFADPIFSSESTGFDEKTVADSAERRLPWVRTARGDHIPQKRLGGRLTGSSGRIFLGRPSVICPAEDINVAPADADEPDLICGREGTVAAPATLVAGEPVPRDSASPLFDYRDIADGLPFVIVSHGHNGFGALNHLVLRQPPRLRRGSECRSFENISVGEAVNLYTFAELTSQEVVTGEFNKCNLGTTPNSPFDFLLFFRRSAEGYFFAHRNDVSAARAASSFSDPPPPIPDRRGTDDLLVWMTRGDLARRMREADVFPLILKDSDRPPVFLEP